MEILLNVIDDPADEPSGIDCLQTVTGSGFDNELVVARPDGCLHVRPKQHNDAILIHRRHPA